jgi:hypothetical protein
MAKTEAPKPRSSRSGTSFIPAAVALIAVGLFIGWLATRRPDPGVAVAEPDPRGAPAAGEATGPATPIGAARLSGAGARELIGQDVELTSVPISSMLGSQLFWIELPDGSPFLVHMDEALMARGVPVQAGRNARIVGRVLDKDTALLDEWQATGVLRSEGDRAQAEYGTTYIEARQVQPAAN